jgi:hypothetical protein
MGVGGGGSEGVVLVRSLREWSATATGISLAVLATAVEIDFNV